MEPFKNIYTPASIDGMALAIKQVDQHFDEKKFIRFATEDLLALEMKARVIQIAHALNKALSGEYKQKIKTLVQSMRSKQNPKGLDGFLLWPYSYFIETQGLDHFKISMQALYDLTQRFTAEWGVRPFLEKYPDQVYEYFERWTNDSNEHVRRWISEGLRPNLPWGKKVSHLKNNLKRNLKILSTLKNDESMYVRKSVANHLNDIAALDAHLLLSTAKTWMDETQSMQRLLKHALRNLLKQGHPQALILFGYNPNAKTTVNNFKLSKQSVYEGEDIDIEFLVTNESRVLEKLMIDYRVHYVKKNGKSSAKVFKLKNIQLKSHENLKIRKKHSFKLVSTRQHYPGEHVIEIQINGLVKASDSLLIQV